MSGQRGPVTSVPPGPTGALVWGMGLLVFACVPFFSSVLASVAMTIAGRSVRPLSPAGVANCRHGANWGLTYLVLTVVLVTTHFGVLFAVGSTSSFYPLGIPITLWGVVTLAHVVICLVGIFRAAKGRVTSPPAIRFFADRGGPPVARA